MFDFSTVLIALTLKGSFEKIKTLKGSFFSWRGFSTRNEHMAHVVNLIRFRNDVYILVEVSFWITSRGGHVDKIVYLQLDGCRLESHSW